MNRVLKFILEYDKPDFDSFQIDILEGLGYESSDDFFESNEVREFRDLVYSREYRATLVSLSESVRELIGTVTLGLKHHEPM